MTASDQSQREVPSRGHASRGCGSGRLPHAGRILRDAVFGDPKRPEEERMAAEALATTAGRLLELLHEREVDYLLVGGLALLQYVEGRNTADVDLIMALEDLDGLPELRQSGRRDAFVRARFGALQVDVLLTDDPLFAHVRERHAVTRSFAERDVPCATVEGLLLLKLYALPPLYRQGSFARVGIYENDVTTLMQAYRPDVAALLDELAAFVGEEDMGSIREIVAEVEARIVRFEGEGGGLG